MYYIYVLKMANDKLYIGFTSDIRKRIKEHQDDRQRELMIKKFGSTYSHLKNRICNSIKGLQGREHPELDR